MKRLLRILLCYIASFAALYLSGFGWLMADMENESRTVWLFLGASLLLATVFILLWELYLYAKREAAELTERIDAMETEMKHLEKREDPEE